MTMPPTIEPPTLRSEPEPARAPLLTRCHDFLMRVFRRLAYFLGPAALTGVLLLLVWFVAGGPYARNVSIAGLASLAGLGTSIVLGEAVLKVFNVQLLKISGLGTWDLAFVAMWVNAASAFWYVFNLDLLERVPKVGPALARMREDASLTVAQRPWIRRLSTVGVGLFVLSPLPGSGSLGGAIIGRMLALGRVATFLTIALSGVVVCAAYAASVHKLQRQLDAVLHIPMWIKIGILLVALFVLFSFFRWLHRRAERMRQAMRAAPGAPDKSSPAAPLPSEVATPL